MSAAVLSGPPLGAWSRKSLPRWCRSRAAQEKRVGPSSIWSRKYRSCSLPWAAERENHLVAASRSCGMPLSACQQEESPRAQAARPLPWRTMPPPATRLSPRPCHPDRAPPVRTGRGSARPPRGHTIRRRSIGHIYDPAPLTLSASPLRTERPAPSQGPRHTSFRSGTPHCGPAFGPPWSKMHGGLLRTISHRQDAGIFGLHGVPGSLEGDPKFCEIVVLFVVHGCFCSLSDGVMIPNKGTQKRSLPPAGSQPRPTVIYPSLIVSCPAFITVPPLLIAFWEISRYS